MGMQSLDPVFGFFSYSCCIFWYEEYQAGVCKKK